MLTSIVLRYICFCDLITARVRCTGRGAMFSQVSVCPQGGGEGAPVSDFRVSGPRSLWGGGYPILCSQVPSRGDPSLWSQVPPGGRPVSGPSSLLGEEVHPGQERGTPYHGTGGLSMSWAVHLLQLCRTKSSVQKSKLLRPTWNTLWILEFLKSMKFWAFL